MKIEFELPPELDGAFTTLAKKWGRCDVNEFARLTILQMIECQIDLATYDGDITEEDAERLDAIVEPVVSREGIITT